MDLTPLLAPRSIAVVGATDRADAYGDTILRNLQRLGFAGPVWGVNPSRSEVRGVPCVPSLAELPEPVDAVAIAIPAARVPATVTAAARRGCGGAVVVSAGFGEVESGRGLELELRDAAAAGGIPVCGPNGNGVVSFHHRAGIWGDSLRPLARGRVAVISQSGNVAVNALGSRRGIGFHTVLSTGNGTVCDATDWLGAVSELDGVGSIALFMEGDGDGSRLAEALARCAERDVRVAVLKVGSSGAGAAAAAAHTGALAGDARVFRALIEEAGAAWARNPHELLELARVLAEPRARPRGDGGLGIVTCSGGDSGNAADEAERLGVELPPLGAATRERLADLLPEAATIANPLDYTSMLWAQRERLAAIVDALGSDPAIDQLLVFHDTPAEIATEAEPGWAATRGGLCDGAAASSAAPLSASTLPDLIGEDVIEEFASLGIASVAGLGTAILCAGELRRPPADPERLREIAAAAAAVSTGFGLAGGPRIPTERNGGSWLGEIAAKRLLREAGVPVAEGRVIAGADDLLAAARELEGPVALKLSSPAIQHKSELGAMALGLADEGSLLAARDRLLALDVPADAELLVEAMVPPGIELFVAAHTDGVVPALVVGLGGIWTESLDDVVVVPLPASAERVRAALSALRAAPVLSGARGRPAIDLDAVATAAANVGDLLLGENLALLELNPLVASPGGCVAVDAVARKTPPGLAEHEAGFYT